jgi:hypothetical protein
MVAPQEPRPALDRQADMEWAGDELRKTSANFRRLGYIR